MTQLFIKTFFYGLFMDPEVLLAANVEPREPCKGLVSGYRLIIGARATLSPSFKGHSFGMLYDVSNEELHSLYSAPGLESYRSQSVLVTLEDGSFQPATTYVLDVDPLPSEGNPEYADKLRAVLVRLGFPLDYVASIA